MDKLQNLQNDIHEWADETFGSERKPIAAAHHLKKEVGELIEALELEKMQGEEDTLMEFADCFILILNISSKYGLNIYNLYELAQHKLAICKARTWGKPDENGVVEHIR